MTHLKLFIGAIALLFVLVDMAPATNAQTAPPQEKCSSWGYNIMFSPTGKFLVANATDTSLWLWEVTSGAHLYTFPVEEANTHLIMSFSSDENYFLINDGTKVTLWDLQTGKIFRQITPDSEQINPILFARFVPHTHKVLTIQPSDATLWDVKTGKKIHVFPTLVLYEYPFDISFNGKNLLLTDGYKWNVWDLETFNKVDSFDGYVAKFTLDSKSVIVYNVSGVSQRSVEKRTTIKVFTSAPDLLIDNFEFSQDKRYIAKSRGSVFLTVWDLLSGEEKYSTSSSQVAVMWAFLPDSRIVIYNPEEYGEVLHLQSLITNQPVDQLNLLFTIVRFEVTPDGKAVLLNYQNGELELRSLTTHEKIRNYC